MTLKSEPVHSRSAEDLSKCECEGPGDTRSCPIVRERSSSASSTSPHGDQNKGSQSGIFDTPDHALPALAGSTQRYGVFASTATHFCNTSFGFLQNMISHHYHPFSTVHEEQSAQKQQAHDSPALDHLHDKHTDHKHTDHKHSDHKHTDQEHSMQEKTMDHISNMRRPPMPMRYLSPPTGTSAPPALSDVEENGYARPFHLVRKRIRALSDTVGESVLELGSTFFSSLKINYELDVDIVGAGGADDGLSGSLGDSLMEKLFLDKYSAADIGKIIETSGIGAILEKKGFSDLEVSINAQNPFIHQIIVRDTGRHHQIMPPLDQVMAVSAPNPASGPLEPLEPSIPSRSMGADAAMGGYVSNLEHERTTVTEKGVLLFQLELRRYTDIKQLKAVERIKHYEADTQQFLKKFVLTLESPDIVCTEWLLMQDPTKTFAPMQQAQQTQQAQRVLAAPGQMYPGLGIFWKTSYLMIQLALKSQRDAFSHHPLYFHNAYLYSRACMFLNPELEGKFGILCRDLQADIDAHGVSLVSKAIHQGQCVHVGSGKRIKWITEEQMFPLSRRLKQLFISEDYWRILALYEKEAGHFRLDLSIPVMSDGAYGERTPFIDIKIAQAHDKTFKGSKGSKGCIASKAAGQQQS